MAIELGSEEVALSGEALHPIWWRGFQWAVTEYGIECLDGTYSIKGDRIVENIHEGQSWPDHMADKVWVDLDEFTTAWLVGLMLHGFGNAINPGAIHAILQRVRPPATP